MKTLIMLAALAAQGKAADPLDSWFEAEWKRLGVRPAAPADDAAFLRRAALDLTGVLPAPEEVRAYTRSTKSGKRAAKIEELLASPKAAEYFGHLWVQWLMGHDVEERDLQDLRLGGLIRWLKDAWTKDLPYDELVRSLLTATGRLDEQPAGAFFAKHLVRGDPPAALAGKTARLFLGLDLRCAQCHDHPFQKISQEDFWGYAAFFRTLRRQGGAVAEGPIPPAGKPRDDLGELLCEPRFPGGGTPGPDETRLQALARLTLAGEDADRALVERTWKLLFGRGLADRPDLCGLLVRRFVEGRRSVKSLLRAIVSSRAYGLSSEGTDALRRDYAVGPLKMMNPVQFMKAWNHAFQFEAYWRVLHQKDPAKAPFFQDPDLFWIGQTMSAKELLFPKGRDPEEALATGTDRLALKLMNNRELQLLMVAKFQQTGGYSLVWRVMRQTEDPARRLEELFLLMVSRPPTRSEKDWLLDHVKDVRNPYHAWSDVFWMLFNSSEFIFIG
jgi:hypothetical protein